MSRVAPQPVRKKEPPFVSRDLRKFAKGKECQLKGPLCNGDTATTVLCHSRRVSGAGMSEKPHDFWGYHGCSACHYWEHMADFEMIYQAIRRTQYAVYAHFGTLTP